MSAVSICAVLAISFHQASPHLVYFRIRTRPAADGCQLVEAFDLLNHIIGPSVYFPFMMNSLNHSIASINRIRKLKTLAQMAVDLSGGQGQRISLARALLADASAWLLDEPTSALDAQTESIEINTVHEMAKSKLILVAAHRQSLIDCADQVVLLKGVDSNETRCAHHAQCGHGIILRLRGHTLMESLCDITGNSRTFHRSCKWRSHCLKGFPVPRHCLPATQISRIFA